MRNLFTKEIFGHPIVLGALGVVVLIAAGSGIYYFVDTRAPSTTWQSPVVGDIEATVTGTGTVEPAQNPDLAFNSGGRVAAVNVSVGQSVSQGQVLATLDTAALSAARAGAEANLAGAQAKLDEMQAGPRQTDVSAAQTAVLQAQTSLANLYATVPAAVEDAYGKSAGDVHGDTDTLFSNPSSSNPTLSFQSSNNQAVQNVESARFALGGELGTWQGEAATLGQDSSPSDLESALTTSINHLSAVRDYSNALLQVLASAVPSGTFTAANITSAQINVAALRDAASGQITGLQSTQQELSTDKLAIQSAQDALNKLLAGSTPQDIAAQQATVEAAQAVVESADAALGNAIVVAPFSGSVSSVAIKQGQIIPAGTTAVSLTPHSALQVDIYATELDIASLKVGQAADVTLDAYGDSRHFPATVASLDTSPTPGQGYKVTLQFTQNDPAIAAGMTANASILAAQKSGVLLIPRSALLQSGDQTFVLVPGSSGPVERQIHIGLLSTSTVEVTQGLSQSDQVLENK